MSKIEISKLSLLTEIFITIFKIYRNKLILKKIFVIVFFFIFFVKNDLGIFLFYYIRIL
jgi:hypothetical protein